MRYIKVTLFIGFVVSLIAAGLHEAGLWARMDAALALVMGRPAPPAADRLHQYPLFILLAFGIAWTSVDISGRTLKTVVAGAVWLQLALAAVILPLFGTIFSPWASLMAVSLSFLCGFSYSQSSSGRRKRVVQEMFGNRISPQSFRALVDSDQSLSFEGELCEASVVVCEIFNHEALSAALPVGDYVAMNNAFLCNAADFLVSQGACLDECGGENLRAIFGAPLPDPRHAVTASLAALGLATRLDAVNEECFRLWQHRFDYRIGINSGEVVVAAYGTHRAGNFSVAGEPVEFARRLCAANTIYGSRILIGSVTHALAETALEVRPMELIQRSQDERSREEIYEVLAPHDGLPPEEAIRRDIFWKALVLFRQHRWDQALELFYQIRLENGADGAVEFYIRRIEQLREGLAALDWGTGRV